MSEWITIVEFYKLKLKSNEKLRPRYSSVRSQSGYQLLNYRQQWLDAVRAGRASGREALSVTVRCWGITSRASPSPLSDVWRGGEEWRGSPDSSMRRPVEFSRFSLRTWSGTLSPTPNTPRGRLSLPWMSSMLSRGRDAPCMDSEDKLHIKQTNQLTLVRATISCLKSLSPQTLYFVYSYQPYSMDPLVCKHFLRNICVVANTTNIQ